MGQISSKMRNLEGGSLLFWCPGCEIAHQVHVKPNGARPCWGYNGNPEKPTFTPSILVTSQHPKGYSNENPAPVGWNGEYEKDICHSFVTDGRIQFLGDCTHKLAGQTVDMPDLPDEWKD